MIINKETFIIARDSVDYAIKLEQELAKLKAENEKLKLMVNKVIAFQRENYGNGINTHVGLIDIASEFKEALGE